jgi:hypothetical protein
MPIINDVNSKEYAKSFNVSCKIQVCSNSYQVKIDPAKVEGKSITYCFPVTTHEAEKGIGVRLSSLGDYWRVSGIQTLEEAEELVKEILQYFEKCKRERCKGF